MEELGSPSRESYLLILVLISAVAALAREETITNQSKVLKNKLQ